MSSDKYKILQKNITIEHPAFLERLIVHFISGKGWMFEFWMGKSFGAPFRYFVLKNHVMEGIFSVTNCLHSAPSTEFFHGTESGMIKYVSNMNKSDFKKLVTQSFVPQGDTFEGALFMQLYKTRNKKVK